MVSLDEINAVAGFIRLPVFGYWGAAEEQRDEVTGEIACNEEQDGPSGVSKLLTGPEDSKVHE